ncbi:hypothetical protein DPMN_066986 [Dreissena polymorpha]|uniref:Uncharacterized protein n=1 Tax=Dreissena polymorpha TaxID=45954 RepID=A0A9D3YYF3_DREPO|nr:hypothetical protein DPMN_066986 [Dreissena polymorpha]
MPTKRQATSSRGVRGRLRSLDIMSNNARSIDDRRSPLNTAIVARRLFAGTTIVARPWSLSLNRTLVSYCHLSSKYPHTRRDNTTMFNKGKQLNNSTGCNEMIATWTCVHETVLANASGQ